MMTVNDVSAQLPSTLRHYLKQRALHVSTRGRPLLRIVQLLHAPMPARRRHLLVFAKLMHDRFKEEMMLIVPQNMLNTVLPTKDLTKAWAKPRTETRRPANKISTWASSVHWNRVATTSFRSY